MKIIDRYVQEITFYTLGSKNRAFLNTDDDHRNRSVVPSDTAIIDKAFFRSQQGFLHSIRLHQPLPIGSKYRSMAMNGIHNRSVRTRTKFIMTAFYVRRNKEVFVRRPTGFQIKLIRTLQEHYTGDSIKRTILYLSVDYQSVQFAFQTFFSYMCT